MRRNRRPQLNITLPADTLAGIDREAARHGLLRTEYARLILGMAVRERLNFEIRAVLVSHPIDEAKESE